MLRAFATIAVVVILLGCAPAQPEPDIAAYVNATLTALAPQPEASAAKATAAAEPSPTATPEPTASPSSTPTTAPTATPTDRPTVTPTATTVPVDVPEGWLSYESLGSPMMTVWYPSTWRVENEKANSVYFDVTERKYAGAMAGLYTDIHCDPERGEDEALRCLNRVVIAEYDSLDTTRIIASSSFTTPLGQAYSVELSAKDYVYENWGGSLWLFSLRPDGSTLLVHYFRIGTQTLTDAERDLARAVFENVRLSP